MIEFITWLLDHSSFMPRSCCVVDGSMPDWIVQSYSYANLVTFLSYLVISISFVVAFFWLRRIKFIRQKLPLSYLLMCSAFILSCGITHGIDSAMFDYPVYRLITIMHIVTATISAITAVTTVSMLSAVHDVIREFIGMQIRNAELYAKLEKMRGKQDAFER